MKKILLIIILLIFIIPVASGIFLSTKTPETETKNRLVVIPKNFDEKDIASKLKKQELPIEAQEINKEISRRRIGIEHINSKLKVFRILGERYRNRRKRFGLRMNLISGLINWMIKK